MRSSLTLTDSPGRELRYSRHRCLTFSPPRRVAETLFSMGWQDGLGPGSRLAERGTRVRQIKPINSVRRCGHVPAHSGSRLDVMAGPCPRGATVSRTRGFRRRPFPTTICPIVEDADTERASSAAAPARPDRLAYALDRCRRHQQEPSYRRVPGPGCVVMGPFVGVRALAGRLLFRDRPGAAPTTGVVVMRGPG
jgi:hypothetical protein